MFWRRESMQEQMRFVTHNDVSREDCGKVLEVVRGICR